MNKPEGFDDTFKPQREDHVYNAEPQRDDHTFDDNKPQRNDTPVGDVTPQRNDTLPDDSKTQRDDNFVIEDKPQADDKPVANDIFDENGFYRISNTNAKSNSSDASQPVTPPKPVANDIFDDDGFYRMVNSTIKSNSSGSSQPQEPVKPPVSNYSTPKTTVPPPKKSNNKGKIILVLFVLATILTAVFLLKQYNTTDLPLISDPTTTVTDSPLVEDTTEYTDDIISEEETEEKTEYNSEVFVEEETEYTIAAEVFVGNNTVDFDSYGSKRYYFDSPESGYYEFKSDNNEDLKITLCVDGGLVLEDDDSGEDRNFVVVAYLGRDSFAHLDISPVSSDTYVSELNLEITKVTETYATGVELFKFYKDNGLYMTNDDTLYLDPSYSSDKRNWVNSKLYYPMDFLVSGNVLWLSFSANNDKLGDHDIWYPIKLTEEYLTGYDIFIHYKNSGLYMTKEDTIYLESPSYSADDRVWTNANLYYPKTFMISEDSTLWLSFGANNDELGEHTVWYPIRLTDNKYISGYNTFVDYTSNGIYMTNDDTLYLDPLYSSDKRNWTNSKRYYPVTYLISEDILWLSFSATNDELGSHDIWYPVTL